jgi:hypothetical protein
MTVAVAALMMMKNEEASIGATLRSLRTSGSGVQTVILYDTGSTDRTLALARTVCAELDITLHVREADHPFRDFATGRNEALAFAATIPGADFLLMMDAGDELQRAAGKGTGNKEEAWQWDIPDQETALHGLVVLAWFEDGGMTEHFDVRFLRNYRGCHYDRDCPVHETMANLCLGNEFMVQSWRLFQDRERYGGSTSRRHQRDIELLSQAPPTPRNLFYLGQSYLATQNYAECYRCNLAALRAFQDEERSLAAAAGGDRRRHQIDVCSIYERLATSALHLDDTRPDAFLPYLRLAIEYPGRPSMDAALNLLRYTINRECPELAEPYLSTVANMQKIPGQSVIHDNYDHTRWSLLYRVCMALLLRAGHHPPLHADRLSPDARRWFELGRHACQTVNQVRPTPEDQHNWQFFVL